MDAILWEKDSMLIHATTIVSLGYIFDIFGETLKTQLICKQNVTEISIKTKELKNNLCANIYFWAPINNILKTSLSVNTMCLCLLQDEKLTVTQAGSVSGAPPVLHFQYQLSERRFSCWDTVLSDNALYLEIPAGALHIGSREGYVGLIICHSAALYWRWQQNHIHLSLFNRQF